MRERESRKEERERELSKRISNRGGEKKTFFFYEQKNIISSLYKALKIPRTPNLGEAGGGARREREVVRKLKPFFFLNKLAFATFLC